MDFLTYLRTVVGIQDPDKLEEAARAAFQKAFDAWQKTQREAAKNADLAQRSSLILGTVAAATGTAADAVRAGVYGYAQELINDAELSVPDAQRKISEKLTELVKADAGTRATRVAEEQQRAAALPTDPDAVLSRAQIVAAFGEVRESREAYEHAARSVVAHLERGDAIPFSQIEKDLGERTAQLIIHEERGRPRRRAITASGANVAIQAVGTELLRKSYTEHPDPTDALVTVVPGGAEEVTYPEVETEEGVRKIKEGQEYPLIGGSDRDVKSSYHKWGAAIAQTRESNVFDKLGRTMIHMSSLARQLRAKRADFRLARICDSNAFDGRYIGRPGNDNGTAAFYSATEDHRGNKNLIASNALADETDLNALVLLLEAMKLLDGTYVLPQMKVLLVPSALKVTAWKIVNSVFAPSAVAATGQPNMPNPYGPGGMYSELPRIVSHPKVATYAGADTTWYGGDPAQQFYEIEHWPIEMVPVLAGGDMAMRDIVGAWKGSWCGDLLALSNMFFVKNTA